MTTVPDAPSPGLLLRPSAAAAYLGVGQSTFYELRRTEGFPGPVDLPGRKEPHYRREDLRAWVLALPRRACRLEDR